jgi:FkbM family methyltransferase
VQQVVVDLAAPTTSIELHAARGALEVVSVLTWPDVAPGEAPALPRHEVTMLSAATASRAGVSGMPVAPPPVVATTDGLHGTYVGDGRVLVRVRGGGRLLVSSADISLMPELVAEGGYDAPFTAFLRRTLGPGSTFVDVGANVGLFTVIGALQGSRVVAYEPAPDLVALLRDNVQLNWLTGRVTVRDAAVADRPGKRPFRFDQRMQLTGRLAAEPAGEPLVEVVTLDDELDTGAPIDLVKIDVEGGEAAVLAGMAALLAAGAVTRISCEVRTDNFPAGRQDPGWTALVDRLGQLAAAGWSTALIDPAGQLVARPLDEIVASEPHPNVVLGRP